MNKIWLTFSGVSQDDVSSFISTVVPYIAGHGFGRSGFADAEIMPSAPYFFEKAWLGGDIYEIEPVVVAAARACGLTTNVYVLDAAENIIDHHAVANGQLW